MPKEQSKLKPCPFCGGLPIIKRKGSCRQSTIIECGDCGCSMETGEVLGMTTLENLAWNTRAYTAELMKPLQKILKNKKMCNFYEQTQSELWAAIRKVVERYLGEK